MKRRVLAVTIPSVLALGFLGPGAALLAETVPPVEPEGLRNGALLYQVHCRSCHGDEGRGDGPVAQDQATSPTDLTALTARNKGRFPKERIELVIDGRHPTESGEARAMPVWGLAFQQPGLDADQGDEVRQRIRDLITYIRSIQTSQ